jgi:hypothetical protein
VGWGGEVPLRLQTLFLMLCLTFALEFFLDSPFRQFSSVIWISHVAS